MRRSGAPRTEGQPRSVEGSPPGRDQLGGGGARAGPPGSAGSAVAPGAAAPAPRRGCAPPCRARSPAFEGPGCDIRENLPASSPAPLRWGSDPAWPALTASEPAPGRRAPGPPPPGRRTRALERLPNCPAVQVARAAAGPRAPSQLAAWREQMETQAGTGRREQGSSPPRMVTPPLPPHLCGPGQNRRICRTQRIPRRDALLPLGIQVSCAGGAAQPWARPGARYRPFPQRYCSLLKCKFCGKSRLALPDSHS